MRLILAALLILICSSVHAANLAMLGEITDDSAHLLSSQIIMLSAAVGTTPTTIYIDSPGGSVPAGGEIIDAIQMSVHPVNCVVIGTAASMAAIIFQYCAHRSMWPHASIMYHLPTVSTGGTPEQVESRLRMLGPLVAEYEEHVARRAHITVAELREREISEWWLSATQAVNAHLADAIMTR